MLQLELKHIQLSTLIISTASAFHPWKVTYQLFHQQYSFVSDRGIWFYKSSPFSYGHPWRMNFYKTRDGIVTVRIGELTIKMCLLAFINLT